MAITPDNRCIISGSYDKSLKIFELQTEQTEQIAYFENAYKGEEIFLEWPNYDKERKNTVVATPDNKYIVSVSNDGKGIKVIDAKTKDQVHFFRNVHNGK